MQPAKKLPEHSPFGFGGNSPRDIQVLVGFRKALRNHGPAAVYLRRRKARAPGLMAEQVATLDGPKEVDDGSPGDGVEEDEFTRQLRQHAERRRREMAARNKDEEVYFRVGLLDLCIRLAITNDASLLALHFAVSISMAVVFDRVKTVCSHECVVVSPGFSRGGFPKPERTVSARYQTQRPSPQTKEEETTATFANCRKFLRQQSKQNAGAGVRYI